MPRFFAHLASYNQPKNALQGALVDHLEKLTGRIVDSRRKFDDDLFATVHFLNDKHSNCKPLRVHDWVTGNGWGYSFGDQFTVGFYLYEIKEDADA